MDEVGQISAELMIILAAMAALALFLIDQLNTTAEDMNESYSTKISEIGKKIENMGN